MRQRRREQQERWQILLLISLGWAARTGKIVAQQCVTPITTYTTYDASVESLREHGKNETFLTCENDNFHVRNNFMKAPKISRTT